MIRNTDVEQARFKADPERMKALHLLVSDWDGLDLYAATEALAERIATTEWPELEVTDTEEGEVRWTCPHCGWLLSDFKMLELCVEEWPAWHHLGTERDIEVRQVHADTETLGFQCPECLGVVDTPEDTSVEYF